MKITQMPLGLLPLLFVTFISTFGFSVIVPFLASMATQYGASPTVFGIVGAMYPAMQIIGSPRLGGLSDRIGRKTALLISQIGTLLSWFIVGTLTFLPTTIRGTYDNAVFGSGIITLQLVALLFARGLDGFTGGNVAVAYAAIADMTDNSSQKKKYYGYMGAALGLGFVLGPAVSGLLARAPRGLTASICITVFISIVALLFIMYLFPSHTTLSSPSTHAQQKISLQKGRSIIIATPSLRYLTLMYLCTNMGVTIFYTGHPLVAQEIWHQSISQIGMFYAYISICNVLTQGVLVRYIPKNIGLQTQLLLGFTILACSFVIMHSFNTTVQYLSCIVYGIGYGIARSSFTTLLSQEIPSSVQGRIQGMSSGVGSIGSVIGMILGGILFNHVGIHVFYASSAMIFIVVFLAIALIYYIQHLKNVSLQ